VNVLFSPLAAGSAAALELLSNLAAMETRIRALVLITAAVLGIATTADGQDRTVDGVLALERGDYATAARILRARADDSEPMAQFFYAAYLQFNYGRDSNPIQACAYYRLSAAAEHPLRSQARLMAEQILEGASPIARDLCDAQTKEVFDRLQPYDVVVGPRNPAPAATSLREQGLRAFIDGDIQPAAEVFAPIVDHWPGPIDDLALFLISTMYETGAGMPRDLVRACALSVRSDVPLMPTDSRNSFFARVAGERVQTLSATLSPDEFAECVMLALTGFDHGFKPVTIHLEPRVWIRFELSARSQHVRGVLITNGKEKEVDVPADSLAPGIRFLPIEHAELQTPGGSRRHFISLFYWLPGSGPWTLVWSLFEVSSDDFFFVTHQEVTTASGQRPPAEDPSIVRDLTGIRLNTDGDVEWAVRGPDPKSEIVDTPEDRTIDAASEARQRSRNAALEGLDWSVRRDPHRQPEFTYVDSDSCGAGGVRAWTADRTEAISVVLNTELLDLSLATLTFDLRGQPAAVKAVVTVLEEPQREFPPCTDVRYPVPSETWQAAAGLATVRIQAKNRRSRRWPITVQLVGLELVNATGARVGHAATITLTGDIYRPFP
jgi:hypothetical protein